MASQYPSDQAQQDATITSGAFDAINTEYLLEEFILEIFSNFQLLNRLKDDVGLITQWGITAWLILQELAEVESMTEEDIGKTQHISESYNYKVLCRLSAEGLILKDHGDISITSNGLHALEKLKSAMKESIPHWENQISEESLVHATQAMNFLRHQLTQRYPSVS